MKPNKQPENFEPTSKEAIEIAEKTARMVADSKKVLADAEQHDRDREAARRGLNSVLSGRTPNQPRQRYSNEDPTMADDLFGPKRK